MASRVEKIEAALREVLYFAKGADIVTLKMVRNISVDGQKINFSLVLPKEDKKSQPVLEKQVCKRDAILTVPGRAAAAAAAGSAR